MKKQVPFSLGVGIIVAVAIAAGCLWYYQVGQYENSVSSIAPQPVAQAVQTYTNTTYGYTVQYPEEWYLDASHGDDAIQPFGGEARGLTSYIGGEVWWSNYPDPRKTQCGRNEDQPGGFCVTLEIYKTSATSTIEQFWEQEGFSTTTVKREDIPVNGRTVITLSKSGIVGPPVTYSYYAAFVKDGDRAFVFTLDTGPKGGNPNTMTLAEWDTMLRSLNIQ